MQCSFAASNKSARLPHTHRERERERDTFNVCKRIHKQKIWRQNGMADRDEVRINNVYRSPAAEHDIISPWLNIQTFNAYSWRTVAMAQQETAITLDEKNRTQIESKTNLQNTTSSIRTSEFVVQEDGSGITVVVVDAVVKVGDVEYENQVKSCIEIIVDIATTQYTVHSTTHNKTNATNLLLFYFGVVFAAYFCNSLCTQS